MNCPSCRIVLRHVKVSVYSARNKAISYQCYGCDHYEFDSVTAKVVIKELKQHVHFPLDI